MILHSEDSADVAAVLGQQFFQRGAYTQVHAFEAEDAAENVRDPGFSHIIAILPRNGHRETDRSMLLNRLITGSESRRLIFPSSACRKASIITGTFIVLAACMTTVSLIRYRHSRTVYQGIRKPPPAESSGIPPVIYGTDLYSFFSPECYR